MLRSSGLSHALRALCFGSVFALAACGDETTPVRDDDSQQDEDPSTDEPSTGDQKDTGPRVSADSSTGGPRASNDAGKPAATKDAGGPKIDPPPAPDAGKPDAGGTPVVPPPGATGPDNGDPAKPVVALPDIACGSKRGLGTANLKVSGRDVLLTYPCDKHEGANVTFILLLHGTNANEASKTYTHNYFAAHTLTTSHNLIIAEPKSRASQWGNTTENPAASEDKPHLLEVIDYVYKNLGTKFNITSTWVGGHSWGSMYAKRFVCDESVKDKVRGVIGMSGGSTAPGGRSFGSSGSDLMPTTNCADYVSQIHTVGDTDSVAGLPDQTAPATKHGCDAKTPAKDLGNAQMLETWPNCDPGWVHENITMGGHGHVTAINPEVVLHIVEQVKATEKR